LPCCVAFTRPVIGSGSPSKTKSDNDAHGLACAYALNDCQVATSEKGRPRGSGCTPRPCRGARCDCFILCANDIGKSEPVEQLVGGGVRQTQRLMSPRIAVVGLRRVDRIQPQLGSSGSIALDPVGAGDLIPLRGIVGCEADRVPIGLRAGNSETARNKEHGHANHRSSEKIDDACAFPASPERVDGYLFSSRQRRSPGSGAVRAARHPRERGWRVDCCERFHNWLGGQGP
jgi:hypothetical protein